MKIIKSLVIIFISAIIFASMYISFEAIHEVRYLNSEIDSLKMNQEKLEYVIENKKDTIIINNYFKIK